MISGVFVCFEVGFVSPGEIFVRNHQKKNHLYRQVVFVF